MTTRPNKMGAVGLTILVAVNMMGSGIIMLPTSLARIGTISMLSWVVTALGSMALAYAFAQSGFFVTRDGGMSAYAEEAHGKSAFFMASYTYYISMVIANVAVALAAVGYLSPFIPWLSATPVHTCIAVMAAIWITALANFGGARLTGRIGAVTVWGVIIPVATLALLGWFWFDPSMFIRAWNVGHKPFASAVSSGIALTLWAFLGMESACANSAAVENPKRNVPIACLAGTGIAAIIYILSTAVIQGIVPNLQLANSSAPFGLAFSTLFSPAVGSLVNMLAVLACIGSLLGWQFTIGQVAKSAAQQGMFPSIFGKVNRYGAPVAGLVLISVVQCLIALMTISPNLNQQFNAIVNLAVFTNLVPYILSLTALSVIMKKQKVEARIYRRNMIITLVALIYSLYGVYAAGVDAVFWGSIVMLSGYIIYGLRAHRFIEVNPPVVSVGLIP
jgi:putrescine:ornithine antiporter